MSLKMAVVGLGRMGKLHARVLNEMDEIELICVVDIDPAVAQEVGRQRDCLFFDNLDGVPELVDAVIIATPTSHHIPVATPFVEAGKSVLIEKPMCIDVNDGVALVHLAAKTGAKIQVGHTERFNPVVAAMRDCNIRPKFIEAYRVSPFTFRSAEIGVVLDMMIHDLDLILTLVGEKVKSISSVGVSLLSGYEDICHARLEFENCVASVTANRVAIKAERKMRIFSDDAYVLADYVKKIGTVVKKRHDADLFEMARELELNDLAQLAETVDYTEFLEVLELPIDKSIEPLRRQAAAFCDAIIADTSPIVSAEDGIAAVQLANDIIESMK